MSKKIEKISKVVQILMVVITLLQVSVYLLLLLFGTKSGTSHYWELTYWGMSSSVEVNFSGAWEGIAQALEKEDFNSFLILGIAETIPQLLIYWYLFILFGFYKQGIIFTFSTIRCIKNIAVVLFASVFLKLFYPLLVAFVIRYIGDYSSLPFILNFGSDELILFALSLIIYVIAWVTREALKLKDEQELVI